MVRGIESFRDWFHDYEDQYVIIGGTACDLLMTEEGLDFRATKDIDMVLIIEAVDFSFGRHFWEYVIEAGYQHLNKSTGGQQFYRFTNPRSHDYPTMIELFTRRLDDIILPETAKLTPLPMDDEISSLSAILLDSDYYEFLKRGRITIDGVTVLDSPYLIPFKAKAWLDDSGGTWNHDDAGWHYVKDGKEVTDNWCYLVFNDESDWYFFKNGVMQTGWIEWNGSMYYLNPESDGWQGRMLTGWQMIDGKWYYFEPIAEKDQGRMYRSEWDNEGFYLGADGVWVSNPKNTGR